MPAATVDCRRSPIGKQESVVTLEYEMKEYGEA